MVPRSFNLNDVDQDNILLEDTKFVGGDEDLSPGSQRELTNLDAALLLALCLDVKNHNVEDGLTREEMHAYVSRVLANNEVPNSPILRL